MVSPDLDILQAVLRRAVSASSLSESFPVQDIVRLEKLGFLCRVGEDYRITASGRDRIVVLSDYAQRLADQVQHNSHHRANQKWRAAAQLVKSAIGGVVGWFLTHTPPSVLFQKVVEFLKSLFH